MTEVKFRTFVIEFKNKPKHDTRWASVTERCKIHAGWCLIDPPLPWPKEENIKVIEHTALAAKDAEIKQLQNELAEKDAEISRLKRECSSMGTLLQSGIVISYKEHDDIIKMKNEIAEKDAVLNEVLSYLEWREDDLIGDDIKGDGRLTARFKQVVSLIEATLKNTKARGR